MCGVTEILPASDCLSALEFLFFKFCLTAFISAAAGSSFQQENHKQQQLYFSNHLRRMWKLSKIAINYNSKQIVAWRYFQTTKCRL